MPWLQMQDELSFTTRAPTNLHFDAMCLLLRPLKLIYIAIWCRVLYWMKIIVDTLWQEQDARQDACMWARCTCDPAAGSSKTVEGA